MQNQHWSCTKTPLNFCYHTFYQKKLLSYQLLWLVKITTHIISVSKENSQNNRQTKPQEQEETKYLHVPMKFCVHRTAKELLPSTIKLVNYNSWGLNLHISACPVFNSLSLIVRALDSNSIQKTSSFVLHLAFVWIQAWPIRFRFKETWANQDLLIVLRAHQLGFCKSELVNLLIS